MEGEPEQKSADPVEMLELVEDHRDRADQLVEEAKDKAISHVRNQLDFDARIRAEYVESMNGIEVTIIPQEVLGPYEDIDGHVISGTTTVQYHPHELSPPEHLNNVLSIIKYLEQYHTNGVPRQTIHHKGSEIGLGTDEINKQIESLRETAEIYEPEVDKFRTV